MGATSKKGVGVESFKRLLRTPAGPGDVRDTLAFISDLYHCGQLSSHIVLAFAESAAKGPSALARAFMLDLVAREVSVDRLPDLTRVRQMLNDATTWCDMDRQAVNQLRGSTFNLEHMLDGKLVDRDLGNTIKPDDVPLMIV